MSTELQPLIDRIREEAVDRGREEAQAIVAKAREKAASLMAEAEEERRRILEQARQEAEASTRRSLATIEQAARDVLILVSQGIESILSELVAESVDQAMDRETLQKMLVSMAARCAAQSGESRLEYLLSREDHEALIHYFTSMYREKMLKGVQLKVDENVRRGFKVAFRDDRVYLDFTAEAVAEALSELLHPHLGDIVKRVAREDPGLETFCSTLLSRRQGEEQPPR